MRRQYREAPIELSSLRQSHNAIRHWNGSLLSSSHDYCDAQEITVGDVETLLVRQHIPSEPRNSFE